MSEENQYTLPGGVSPKVIQERIAKRKPNPAHHLTKKEYAEFRFRAPKVAITRSSIIKAKPRWQVHDYKANKNGGRQLIVLDDGTEYVGGWKNNLRHGFGQHFTAKGVYEGEFVDDLYEGNGIYFIWNDFPNMDGLEGRFVLYSGGWLAGKMSGKGQQWTLKGDSYDGDFLLGKRDGNGVMNYSDGSKYEGQWEKDLRHGIGKLTKANEDWFQGEYVNDKRNGHGELHLLATQRRLEGMWKDDEFIGGSYYDEPEEPKYVKESDISGTKDGMIPTIEVVGADAILKKTFERYGFGEDDVANSNYLDYAEEEILEEEDFN